MIFKMFLQRITRVHILLAVFFACLVFVAHATDIQEEIQYKESVIQKLKEEITQIDSEMMRCQNTKKKWKTATIIGGVGVVATGTAAIVQTVNANKSEADKDKK